MNETLQAMTILKWFIGPAQLETMGRNAQRGEEREFFRDKLCALADLVSKMPKTYEQDGKGDAALVGLHYFAGGRASWWITEKDAGSVNDPAGVNPQHQAFGLADLFGDGGELGYISIAEILENGGELDLYFTPKTLAEAMDTTLNGVSMKDRIFAGCARDSKNFQDRAAEVCGA